MLTCKKVSCYVRDSAYKWLIVENTWIFWSYIKGTHREKVPSTKTPAFTKSINMDICVVNTSSQLFIRGFYIEKKNF